MSFYRVMKPMSTKDTENELVYRVGKLLETIGDILIKDDYKDYLEKAKAHPGLHHYMYGEMLSYVGKEVQKESGFKEESENGKKRQEEKTEEKKA